MNWLFGKSKSNLPEPTALQAQKSKQIEQLKSFNQNVTEVHRDIEYRVNSIVNGTTISFYITLPPQFPHEKPLVKVAPALRHPWVNDQMLVVGCSGINNFMVHSDLGKVIRQLVDEFQRVPPTIQPPQAYMPYSVQQPNTGVGYPTSYSQVPGSTYMPTVPMPTLPAGPGQQPAYPPVAPTSIMSTGAAPTYPPASAQPLQSSSSYTLPEIPSSFHQIKDLSNSELQQLADDEDGLLQLILRLPQMQQIHQDRDEISSKNEALARENMSKRPVFEDKKRILLEKYEQLTEARQRFESQSSQQDELRRQFDPSTLQARLKVAASQAEEEAEMIAEKFLAGNISVEEFNKKYMQVRKLSHMRKVKEEKLSQFIFQGHSGF